MLVLSRRKNEQIVIGTQDPSEPILITVCGIGHDKVRIGVEAPREISVHRREVADAIGRDGQRKEVSVDP